MRRMNELKKEKEALMKQVDIEEDHITNKLIKKLDEVETIVHSHYSYKEKKLLLNRN